MAPCRQLLRHRIRPPASGQKRHSTGVRCACPPSSRCPKATLQSARRKQRAARAEEHIIAAETAAPTAIATKQPASTKEPKRRSGVPPKEVVEFPIALWAATDDPVEFHDALDLQMRRHGDSWGHLHRAIVRPTARRLLSGQASQPRPRAFRAPVAGVTPSERRRIFWHRPEDFDNRSPTEREEILTWIREVIISGSTDYRRFQIVAMTTENRRRMIPNSSAGLERPHQSYNRRSRSSSASRHRH